MNGGRQDQPAMFMLPGQNLRCLLEFNKITRATDNWVTLSERVPLNMHKLIIMRVCRVSSGLCSLFIHSVVSNNSVSGQ